MENTTSKEVVWHAHGVSREDRSRQKSQKPCLLWFTGLSGAGKSTVANALDCALFEQGKHTFLLDGDNVRHGLNKDLGFSDADRVENIRRIGEASKLFSDAGLIVLSAFISPFISDRQMVRSLFTAGEFIEIFVSTPIDVCEQRDPKGLYKKARAGKIKYFTGIDSDYEEPVNPDIILDTSKHSVDECVEELIELLKARKII
ncbi:adenylyl-sulfate kinase [Litoribrevibacter albus]|uniref:Adenylyl-sulfate kinase n=1 Tax=Litoribrevibacter albus TaxID=1473156 RepID=A0AA37SBP7_9GAMM|nr:adenylyl-sulfate kinase [Litoribrevibacter albus]GLQ33202.1 adenylyl-sulfate kinase [Litoribrevibacter albus]